MTPILFNFGTFGKYRNRTDIDLPRYWIFLGTDRYQLGQEPNLLEYRGIEHGSVLPNAKGDPRARERGHMDATRGGGATNDG
jgi:hypothetical protein